MATHLPQLFLYAPSNLAMPTGRITEKGTHNRISVRISAKAIRYSPHLFHAVKRISGPCIVDDSPISLNFCCNFLELAHRASRLQKLLGLKNDKRNTANDKNTKPAAPNVMAEKK